MSLKTALELYQEYKKAYHGTNEALEALKRNWADEATIKKVEKAYWINESLANLWGRIYRYGLPDQGEFHDPYKE